MVSIDDVSQPNTDDIIIDVRHPDEAEQRPLTCTANKILSLPYFNIKQRLPELDKQQSYLLYCEKGIMSRIHADAMQKSGFKKIAVFVPDS